MKLKVLARRFRLAWSFLRVGGLMYVGISREEGGWIAEQVQKALREQDAKVKAASKQCKIERARIAVATRRVEIANREVEDIRMRVLYPYDVTEPEDQVFV